MKKLIFLLCMLAISSSLFSQVKKVELFDLVKKLLIGDISNDPSPWAVGKPNLFPVKWDRDGIEMSDDMTINFYRKGIANLMVNGVTYTTGNNQPIKWEVMLKGPRMGYSSFNITSVPNKNIQPKQTIDSLFGKKPYTFKLLQSCDKKATAGFYYYEASILKDVTNWLKIGWSCTAAGCAISVDCYDDWSKQYAILSCP